MLGCGVVLGRRLREEAACDPDPWQERADPVHPKQFEELDLVAVAEGASR